MRGPCRIRLFSTHRGLTDLVSSLTCSSTAKKVDAPDGEHDLEDVEEHHRGVQSIIANASVFEKPDEIIKQQAMRIEVLKKQMRDLEGDM